MPSPNSNYVKYHRFKVSFYLLVIISGILLMLGIFILRTSLMGIVIIFLSIASMFSAFEELQKFQHFESNLKESFSLHKLADFGNYLYEHTYRHLRKK